jgi:hypothetical protein
MTLSINLFNDDADGSVSVAKYVRAHGCCALSPGTERERQGKPWQHTLIKSKHPRLCVGEGRER